LVDYFNTTITPAAGPHRGRLAPHQRPLAAAICTIDFDEDTATDNVYSYTVSDTSLELDNMTGNVFMLRKQ
jgi:hypothetical protein